MVRFDRVDKRITVTKLLPFILMWLLIPLITYPGLRSSAQSLHSNQSLDIFDSVQQLPLAFVPQQGFFDVPAGFTVRSPGGDMFFRQEGVTLSLSPHAAETERSPLPATSLHIQFEGANPYPAIEGINPLAGTINDFRGNDPTQWQTDLPAFAGITYFDLYPGIYLYYEGLQGRLKSTYLIAPGADPTPIAWRYAGADNVQIDASTGDLLVTMTLDATGETYQLREQAPIAWQEIHGKRVPVEAGYVMTGERITFSLGAYHPAYALFVDRSYAGR